MELLSVAAFTEWAGAHGIAWDQQHPRAHQLSYVSTPGHWRVWELPPSWSDLAWFANIVLETAAPGGDLIVHPRVNGNWYTGGHDVPWMNEALDVVVHGANIPHGFQGAARFAAHQRPTATALVVASLVFALGVGEDYFVLPADASCILMTDHHRAIFG